MRDVSSKRGLRRSKLAAAAVVCLGLALAKPAAADTASTAKPHKHVAGKTLAAKPAGSTPHSRSKKSTGKRSRRGRGQQKIDGERARQIQEALIREHYLPEGAASGWNQSSEEAMRKFQADHGWQTKEVPDSRALIALGLGPSNDHLLNPESAMTAPLPKATAGGGVSKK